ncbi:MAG: helix-turn-helix transcriptional regulator [Pseudomonadota bacterium]
MKDNIALQNKVCKRLDEIIKLKGLRRKDLAAALQLTPSLISRMFKCESKMSISQLDSICSFLNIEISDIFSETMRPDNRLYIFEEEESDAWCTSEISVYIMILLLKWPLSKEEIVECFSDKKKQVAELIEMLKRKDVVICRPDGKLLINPPTHTRYQLGRSKKFIKTFLRIHEPVFKRYFKSPNQSHGSSNKVISRIHLNWFTESQLYYLTEQISNLHSAVSNFIVDNRKNNYDKAKYMHLIYLNNFEIMDENKQLILSSKE